MQILFNWTSQQRNNFKYRIQNNFLRTVAFQSQPLFLYEWYDKRAPILHNLWWKGVIIKISMYKRTSILINWCIISRQPLSVLRPVKNIENTPDRWMTRSGINQICIFIFRIFFIFLVLFEYCCCWLKLPLASLDITFGRKWVCTKSIK